MICGAGPIGLVNLLTARAMGASQVVVTDIMDNRLEVAKSMGATHVYKVILPRVTRVLYCDNVSRLEVANQLRRWQQK